MIRFFVSNAAIVCIFMLAAAKPAVSQSETQSGAVKCVKRQAGLQPPKVAMPLRRAANDKQEEYRPPRQLKPVCPEGEVPVVVAPNNRHFIKGNPMLGNYAAPGPAHPLPPQLVNHLLLPFDQVYWKRDGGVTRSPVNPATGSGDPPCDGVSWFGSCFYYGTASEMRAADGGGMTYNIENPVVDNSGDDGGHSIGEIAVMGAGSAGGSLDDVEMGFSVSPDQFGDNRPHLFVYHWINGAETCYSHSGDLCGWNQYSSTYSPYMDLSSLVGADVYIGWVHFEGAWWGWFNDQWLGYFKDSEWSGTFTKTAQIQWYGEVASNNGIPPKTQMGNGKFPSNATAALMETLCDVDAKAWVCFYRDLQTTGATKVSDYDILNHVKFGAVRYGGPGQ
jgi:hypothetical protein